MLTPYQRRAATETYNFYDLWVKDPSTRSWGTSVGTTQGGVMHGITVKSHLTRVFKVVRVDKTESLKTNTGGIRKVEEL
jgi:hypothetical protein